MADGYRVREERTCHYQNVLFTGQCWSGARERWQGWRRSGGKGVNVCRGRMKTTGPPRYPCGSTGRLWPCVLWPLTKNRRGVGAWSSPSAASLCELGNRCFCQEGIDPWALDGKPGGKMYNFPLWPVKGCLPKSLIQMCFRKATFSSLPVS